MRQKNNQSETGQNNLFWDNLFGTSQPSDWLKYPGDPGKLICSRVHSGHIWTTGVNGGQHNMVPSLYGSDSQTGESSIDKPAVGTQGLNRKSLYSYLKVADLLLMP